CSRPRAANLAKHRVGVAGRNRSELSFAFPTPRRCYALGLNEQVLACMILGRPRRASWAILPNSVYKLLILNDVKWPIGQSLPNNSRRGLHVRLPGVFPASTCIRLTYIRRARHRSGGGRFGKPAPRLLQLQHARTFHRRHRHHQLRLHPTRRPARPRSHCAHARPPFGRSAPRRPHPRRRHRRPRFGRLRLSLPLLRRRRRLDRLHPGPHRARPRSVPRPHPPIRLHQLRQRLSEAPRGLPHHRIHASLQPLLAVLPRQDRLRTTPPARLARRRLPGHHRPPLAHLWRHPDCPRPPPAAHAPPPPRPPAPRPRGHRPRRRLLALDHHPQQRFR